MLTGKCYWFFLRNQPLSGMNKQKERGVKTSCFVGEDRTGKSCISNAFCCFLQGESIGSLHSFTFFVLWLCADFILWVD